LFVTAIICWLISWIISANTGFDIHLLDTMYVISYKWVLIKYSVLFGIISLIYFLFPIIFKRDFNIRLARIHFWVTFIGLTIVVTLTRLGEEIYRPQRYLEYGGWNMYNRIDYYKLLIIFPVFFVLIAQLVFIFNMIHVILKPRDGR
jgi:cytochrome c oxidase subunit 1